MKRMVCLALLLLVPALAHCEENVDALLEQLARLMDAREYAYEREAEAYDAFAAFCERNDYSSLLAARLAGDRAVRELADATEPELTLSDDALLALMGMGVETDVVEAEFAQSGVATAATGVATVESLLYANALQLSQRETLAQWAQGAGERLALNAAYDCVMMNYLLVPLSGEEAVRAFWREIPARWPVIGAAQSEWEPDQGALIGRAEAILSGLEAVVQQYSFALGEAEYAFERFCDAVERGDVEALREDYNPVSGMPVIVPLAQEWMAPERTQMYAVYGEAQQLPTTLALVSAGVTQAEYDAYIDTLLALGASVYSREGGEGEDVKTALVVDGHVLLLLRDPEGTVTAGYDPSALTLESALFLLL